MLKIRNGFSVVNALGEELRFMKAFINQQEKQIEAYIKDIDNYVENVEVEQWFYTGPDTGEAGVIDVQHIEGITEDEYDFKAIFTEVMPAYQRESMLITLWARHESRLDDIVRDRAGLLNKKRKKKENGISDFEHLVNELKRYGVDLKSKKEVEQSYNILNDEVRHIRTSCVHHGGRPRNSSVIKIVDAHSGLCLNSGRIDIGKDYLDFVVKNMFVVSHYIYSELAVG